MARVIISSDSTCDLGRSVTENYGINIFPLNVILGPKQYKDGIDITPEMIFDYVDKNKVLPKTSAGSVADYEKFFSELLEGGNELVHINISSKASVTHENAMAAAKKIGKAVYVVDSTALSTGQGLAVLKACDLRDEGKKASEIADYINSITAKIQTSFVVDRMDYLHKGGRCSSVALIATKILKIHPYIDMVDGALTVKKKFIGTLKRCLDLYVATLAAENTAYDRKRCFITHTRCDPVLVDMVREKVQANFYFDEIIETDAGSVITSHCGKGTLGVLFIRE